PEGSGEIRGRMLVPRVNGMGILATAGTNRTSELVAGGVQRSVCSLGCAARSESSRLQHYLPAGACRPEKSRGFGLGIAVGHLAQKHWGISRTSTIATIDVVPLTEVDSGTDPAF